MDLGVNFSPATNLSRDIMSMGPDVFTGSRIGNQPTDIGNNFYEALTEGKPQVEVPTIKTQSVAISQKTNLNQNDLSQTTALRSQIRQAKNNFMDTMYDARMEAGKAIMDAAGPNKSAVARALFPNTSEALNFVMACDPSFIGCVYSVINSIPGSNKQIEEALENALSKLHDASQSKQGKAPKSQVSWSKFNQNDLKCFVMGDPMKIDSVGQKIADAEKSVSDMERNQGDLDANYTKSGDSLEKACYAIVAQNDDVAASLVGAEAIKPLKCAAECMAAPAILLGLKGIIVADNENTPILDSVEDVSNTLSQAAIKMEPTSSLKKLLEASMNPFALKTRKAA